MAVDHFESDASALQRLAQQGIDWRANALAITLDAVGLPRHIQAGEQGEVECALVGESCFVQAGVREDEFAVDGGHERGGVGNHPIVYCCSGFDARLLLICNVLLLKLLGCALVFVAPLSQIFVDGDGALA